MRRAVSWSRALFVADGRRGAQTISASDVRRVPRHTRSLEQRNFLPLRSDLARETRHRGVRALMHPSNQILLVSPYVDDSSGLPNGPRSQAAPCRPMTPTRAGSTPSSRRSHSAEIRLCKQRAPSARRRVALGATMRRGWCFAASGSAPLKGQHAQVSHSTAERD
jgi:hypothetical protein